MFTLVTVQLCCLRTALSCLTRCFTLPNALGSEREYWTLRLDSAIMCRCFIRDILHHVHVFLAKNLENLRAKFKVWSPIISSVAKFAAVCCCGCCRGLPSWRDCWRMPTESAAVDDTTTRCYWPCSHVRRYWLSRMSRYWWLVAMWHCWLWQACEIINFSALENAKRRWSVVIGVGGNEHVMLSTVFTRVTLLTVDDSDLCAKTTLLCH